MKLHIRLLGGFRATWDGEPLPKLQAPLMRRCIAYLVLHRETPQMRTHLAALFWPEMPEGQSRRNLRQLLYRLRRQLPEADRFINAQRKTVQWRADGPCVVDVDQFETAVREAETILDLETAVSLYQGPLLPGHYDEWLLSERERLHQLVVGALHRLVNALETKEEYRRAITYARELVERERMREASYRLLMRLHIANADRAAALRVYDECVTMLAEKMGVGPSPALEEVHRRAQALHLDADPPHNLPPQPTPFIGRKADLADVVARLTNPDCRLLAVVGLGGAGKTRLALQAAHRVLSRFPHGVFFVPLGARHGENGFVTAVAEAVRFTFGGRRPLRQQLLDYLRQKQLLLLLDGFEAVQEHADLLVEMLQTAPNLKLLVTSRRHLPLRWAWHVALGGLDLPEEGAVTKHDVAQTYSVRTDAVRTDAVRTDAVRLFLQTAQRARRRFSLTPENEADVIRICRLVDGLPLALELAAAWTRAYAPAQIADQIATGLEFLDAPLQDVPPQQRSIRAAFDYSWQQLSSLQQEILARLSAFPHTFSSVAAHAVADADLPALRMLAQHSLVQSRGEGSGRFNMHPLVREYATLVQPELAATARRRHADYFTTWLARRASHLIGARQQATLQAIAAELENVITAWNTAVSPPDTEMIERSLDGFYLFLMMQSRFQQGSEYFATAVDALSDHPDAASLRARIQARLGVFSYQIGENEAAGTHLTAARRRLEEEDASLEVAFCDSHLGFLAFMRGDFPAARERFQRSLAVYQAAEETHREDVRRITGLAMTLNHLGLLASNKGEIEKGEAYLQRSLALRRSVEDRWGMATVQNNLGILAGKRGELEEAGRYFRASLEIKQAFGDKRGVSGALSNLGVVAHRQGDYEEAQTLHERSLALKRELGVREFELISLVNLIALSRMRGRYDTARRFARQALRLGQELGAQTNLLSAVADVALLFEETNYPERAWRLAHFVAEHPATDKETVEEMDALRLDLEERLSGEETAVSEADLPPDLQTLVTNLLADL